MKKKAIAWLSSPNVLSFALLLVLVYLANLELAPQTKYPWLVGTVILVVFAWPVIVNNSILIPRLLQQEKKKYRYWMALALLLTVAATVVQVVGWWLDRFFPDNQNDASSNFLDDLFTISLALFLTMSTKLTLEWFSSQKKIAALEKEKYEVELDLLKNQINPHFLFNTLNNLYGLIMQDPTRSQQVVLKLSALMRYNLYDAQKHLVALDQEITYIRNYLELQQLRSPGVHVEDVYQLPEGEAVIPPQLLLTFVENAFKHGFGSGVRDPFVRLGVHTEGNTIYFHISNNYLRTAPTDEAHGIGLTNTRRRLKLIYQDRFRFEIKKTADTYAIQLMLPFHP